MMKKRCLGIILGIIAVLFIQNAFAATDIVITAAPDKGTAPLTVDFSVQTSMTLNSSSWDFNNDGLTDATLSHPEYVYSEVGNYTVRFTGESTDGQILQGEKMIEVSSLETTKEADLNEDNQEGLQDEASSNASNVINSLAFSVSVLASKTSGTAPLTVQFTSSASTAKKVSYAWDFNSDQITDSNSSESTYTFNQAGEKKVLLTVKDENNNTVTKLLSISILETPENKLNFTSYFPMEFQEGENEITFIIVNNGEERVEDITTKIIGASIKFISSTEVQSLSPQEEDSITVKVNFLKPGTIPGTLKLKGKSIPLSFTVKQKRVYSQEELTVKLNELKSSIQKLDEQYYEKKSQDYLVAEIFDSIKDAKSKIQDAQEQLLTNNLAEASVTLDILTSIVEDTNSGLENAKKKEVTILQWLKENALAITAIVAAFGTLSGIIIKVTKQARKIGEDVKNKVTTTINTKNKKDKEKNDSTSKNDSNSRSKEEKKNETSSDKKEKEESNKNSNDSDKESDTNSSEKSDKPKDE